MRGRISRSDFLIGARLVKNEILGDQGRGAEERYQAAMSADVPSPSARSGGRKRRARGGGRSAQARAFQRWYEMFPRSARSDGRHGSFKDVVERAALRAEDGLRRALPAADPSDRHHRAQGQEQRASRRSRATSAAPGRSARRRAGTRRSIRSSARSTISVSWSRHAKKRSIEIALDIAFQCSPDHPYVSEHPEWFRARPDGTVQYAENPPKKYQDIYPFDFETAAWRSAVGGAEERLRVLDRAGRDDLPRRQPAHQAVRLLGVVHRAS